MNLQGLSCLTLKPFKFIQGEERGFPQLNGPVHSFIVHVLMYFAADGLKCFIWLLAHCLSGTTFILNCFVSLL